MITQVFKSAINYFNAVNSEVMYWKQVDELQRELEKTGNALSVASENEEYLRVENKALKEEVQLFKDSYSSLLKDYYEMMDRHREFKRESLAKIEELQSKVD